MDFWHVFFSWTGKEIDTEVAMRATAGHVADKTAAYRCLCCGRRVFMRQGDVFERCRSCDCSIFEPD
jgi:hypothetical protein